ncbi:hypothetical protein M0804_013528 [Polistes exclamans]|nr:hypothetical protein M0804_013528 [Polistes exclamans]
MFSITHVIALIVIIILLFYIIKYISDKFREYNLVKKCPGPKAYPLIGNLHMFLGDLTDITHKLIKSFANYSSPWRLWIGPKLVLIFDDPENINILSNSSYGFKKSQVYDFIKPYFGNGLLTAPDSLLEIDLDLQNNLELKFQEYIIQAIDLVSQRMFKIWLHPDVTFNNSSLGKKIKALLPILNKFTSEIITKKRKTIKEGKILRESKGLNKSKNKSSFLDVLFIAHNENGEISEQDIRDEINTLVITGSESTAGTLTFLFLMLASFPDIQQQAYEELYDIYGSSDANDVPITLEDINKMKYLERVIKETLRLFPAAPFIARTLSSDTKVDENLVIPKNCNVLFSIFTLHRKEKYWTEPLRFNPDRFLPGNYNQKCFLPFSSGERGCIGNKFAMIEMKVIVATVLRKFAVQIDDIVSIENVNLKFSITLEPAEPIFLRFNKR